jgi:hypothetical protein
MGMTLSTQTAKWVSLSTDLFVSELVLMRGTAGTGKLSDRLRLPELWHALNSQYERYS